MQSQVNNNNKGGFMNHKLTELATALNLNDDNDFITFEGTRYKMAHLPVWGSVMTDTHNVWSWDNTHYITQDLRGSGKFIMLLRGDK